jgi:hypothetical protein
VLNFFLLTVADAAAAHLFLNSGLLSLLLFFVFLFLLYERLLLLGTFSGSGIFGGSFFSSFFLILFFHCGMYMYYKLNFYII